MENNFKFSEEINGAKDYTFQILDETSSINVYTNVSYLYRTEKHIKNIILQEKNENIDMNALFLACYFITLNHANNTIGFDYTKADALLDSTVAKLTAKVNINEVLLKKAVAIARECLPIHEAISIEAQIINDSAAMDFVSDRGREHVKLLYEQMILQDIDVSKNNWYDTLIPMIQHYEIYTKFGKKEIEPKTEKLVKRLKKEKKEIENRNDLLVQKELNISDLEIKSLKKGLAKINDRDDRGIQTLFRNTSKNHYTLNKMVDGKARIMITVVSILLSLVASGVLGQIDQGFPAMIPAIIFLIANLVSIAFAIISITPNKTQGNFTEEEIRSKKGNLLYFGNFHSMHYRDFEWAFLQMLQDKDYLYSSMIRDLYYQGEVLHRKSWAIRISLFAFLFGLVSALISSLIVYYI